MRHTGFWGLGFFFGRGGTNVNRLNPVISGDNQEYRYVPEFKTPHASLAPCCLIQPRGHLRSGSTGSTCWTMPFPQHFVIQADNTIREHKNNTILRWLALLVSTSQFRSCHSELPTDGPYPRKHRPGVRHSGIVSAARRHHSRQSSRVSCRASLSWRTYVFLVAHSYGPLPVISTYNLIYRMYI